MLEIDVTNLPEASIDFLPEGIPNTHFAFSEDEMILALKKISESKILSYRVDYFADDDISILCLAPDGSKHCVVFQHMEIRTSSEVKEACLSWENNHIVLTSHPRLNIYPIHQTDWERMNQPPVMTV